MVAYEKPITALVWLDVDTDPEVYQRLLTLCGVNRVLVAHSVSEITDRLDDCYIDVVLLAGTAMEEAGRIAKSIRRADGPSPFIGVALVTDQPDCDEANDLLAQQIVNAVAGLPQSAADLEPVLDRALHGTVGAGASAFIDHSMKG